MVQFIKVGADRIKLDTIERYGIKFGVRYLLKDADEVGVETDKKIFQPDLRYKYRFADKNQRRSCPLWLYSSEWIYR